VLAGNLEHLFFPSSHLEGVGPHSNPGSLAKFAAMKVLRKISNPKRREAQQRLGPEAGVSNAEKMKTRCPGKSRSTPLPNVPLRFEVNVTARGQGDNAREGGLIGLGYSLPPGAVDSSPSPVWGLTRHSHYKCRGVIRELKGKRAF